MAVIQYLIKCKCCGCTAVANFPMYEEYICDECKEENHVKNN